MTYKEKYHTFNNYQKAMAQQALEWQLRGEYFDPIYSCIVYLFKVSDKYLTANQIKAKEKAIKAIEYLKEVVNGNINDPIYLLYWEHLKDIEFPTWRK